MRKTLISTAIAAVVVLAPVAPAFAHADTVPTAAAVAPAPVAREMPDPLDLTVALSGGMLGGAVVGGVTGAGVGVILCTPTVGLACPVTIPAGVAIGILTGAAVGYGIGAGVGFSQ